MSSTRFTILVAWVLLALLPGLVSADPVDGKIADAEVAAERLFEDVCQRFGGLERVALLTAVEFPGAGDEEAATRAVCARLGIACETRSCAGKSGLVMAVRDLRGKVDLIITSSQDLLTANWGALTLIAHTTPLVSFAQISAPTESAAGGF